MSFRFKQFSAEDDRSSMRIGTDAVLLGSYIKPGDVKNILDIGTGCGVIALMMAQKCNAAITAIDMDENSIRQASANFLNSPWSDRMDASHCLFQEFASRHPGQFDLVITNPPYFSNSLRSPKKTRNVARHDDLLNVHDLLEGVTGILSRNGHLCLILPAAEATAFTEHAGGYNLYLKRQLLVKSKPGFPVKRIIMEFSFSAAGTVITDEVIIRREDDSFTEAYRALTRDFYLEF